MYDNFSVQSYVMREAAELSPGRYLERVPNGTFVRPESLPGTRAAASCAVSRAAKSGGLVQIRRGLYYKATPTRYGVAKPPPLEVALEVLGRKGVGPTGHSAARAFGLTTQIPATPELAVAGPLPTSVAGVRLHRRNNMMRRDLGYHEVALLELLRDWDELVEGGWSALVAAVKQGVDEKRLRLGPLERTVASEHHPKTRALFAALLAELESDDASTMNRPSRDGKAAARSVA